jgi:methylated-DNA-[protein]-cysteine S-methyltransferase
MRIIEAARLSISSPLGPITLTAVNEKITGVELGKKVKPVGNAKVLLEAENQLVQYFQGKIQKFSLPTQVSGTDFQKSVWQEIAKLKAGQSTSYGEIAIKIGKPLASRAVGAAVGANPLPLIVGCHRVLGSSGKLTGYTGGKGLATKKLLLELEGIKYSK